MEEWDDRGQIWTDLHPAVPQQIYAIGGRQQGPQEAAEKCWPTSTSPHETFLLEGQIKSGLIQVSTGCDSQLCCWLLSLLLILQNKILPCPLLQEDRKCVSWGFFGPPLLALWMPCSTWTMQHNAQHAEGLSWRPVHGPQEYSAPNSSPFPRTGHPFVPRVPHQARSAPGSLPSRHPAPWATKQTLPPPPSACWATTSGWTHTQAKHSSSAITPTHRGLYAGHQTHSCFGCTGSHAPPREGARVAQPHSSSNFPYAEPGTRFHSSQNVPALPAHTALSQEQRRCDAATSIARAAQRHDSQTLQGGVQAGPRLHGEGKVLVFQLPFSLIPMFDCPEHRPSCEASDVRRTEALRLSMPPHHSLYLHMTQAAFAIQVSTHLPYFNFKALHKH